MFRSVYSTTFCRDYRVGEIVKAIQKARLLGVGDVFPAAETSNGNRRILQVTHKTPEIPTFGHPLVVFHQDDEEMEYSQFVKEKNETADWEHPQKWSIDVYIDIRHFTRPTKMDTISVSSTTEYDLLLLRASLIYDWTRGDTLEFISFGAFPLMIFSRWIAEQLTRKLALDPGTQLKVTVLTAYYYLCMFGSSKIELEERDKIRMATLISKATYTSVEQILKIIEPVPVIVDVKDFCNVLISNSDTKRFEGFNAALLYTIISGSWYGFNSRETLAVALEHPPTFLALLYKAVQDRSYRKTILGTMALNYNKGDSAAQFVKNIDHFLMQAPLY